MEIVHVVVGVIVHNRKLLLIQRAKEPLMFYWSTPGGRVEENEEEKEAVKREVQEEIAVDVSVGDLYYEYDSHHNDKIYRIKAYYCSVNGSLNPVLDKNEISAWALFTYDEALKLQITVHVKNILLPKLKEENKID